LFVKDLYPKDRILYIVVPIDHPDYDEIPHVWDMSVKLFAETLADTLDQDKNKDKKGFPDLENGLTLEMELKWKKLGKNSFPEVTHIDFLERKPYDESILDEVPNLDEILNVLPYDEIKEMFFEEDTGSEEDGGRLSPVKNEEREERRERSTERTRETRGREERTERRTARETEPREERRSVRSSAEKTTEKRTSSRSRDEADAIDSRKRPERTSSRAAPERTSSRDSKEKCPYEHKYGVDTERFADCDNCDLFDDCIDERDRRR
jgi:hypothetical protein